MSAHAESRHAMAEDMSFLGDSNPMLYDDEEFSNLALTDSHPLGGSRDGYEQIGDGTIYDGNLLGGTSYGTNPFFGQGDHDPEQQEGLGGAVSLMKTSTNDDDEQWQTFYDFSSSPTRESGPHLGRTKFARSKPVKSFFKMEHTDAKVRTWYCKSLASLPMQILVQILGYLDSHDLVRLSFTCHRFYEIANRDIFWQLIYEDQFGQMKQQFRDSHCTGYRDLYVDTISRFQADPPDASGSAVVTSSSSYQHVNDHEQEWSSDDNGDSMAFKQDELSEFEMVALVNGAAGASSDGNLPCEDDQYDATKGEYDARDIPMDFLSGTSSIATALPIRRHDSSDDEDGWD